MKKIYRYNFRSWSSWLTVRVTFQFSNCEVEVYETNECLKSTSIVISNVNCTILYYYYEIPTKKSFTNYQHSILHYPGCLSVSTSGYWHVPWSLPWIPRGNVMPPHFSHWPPRRPSDAINNNEEAVPLRCCEFCPQSEHSFFG